uniref:Kinesin motor domain-containing protein n=1 Tax=Eptatretus burgeri TaxID=7764 RepID=A0A8C4QZC5_EPTBU
MSCGAIALSHQQIKSEKATKMAIFAAAASKKGYSSGEEFITAFGACSSQDGLSAQSQDDLKPMQNKSIFVDGDRFEVKPEHGRYLLWMSYYEVYNEVIYDLLCPANTGSASRLNTLRLAEDRDAKSYVKDLTWIHVNSIEEAFVVLNAGRQNQSMASTKLNKHSSRSHSIFSIRLIQRTDNEHPVVKQVNEFSVCDLAGSERSSKTHSSGNRLQEACKINRSLLSLGKCIWTLRQNQQRSQQSLVPYRESKLTQIFQSFLSGRGHACMVVNINPLASMFDENFHVLKFSALAKQVVTCTLKPPGRSRKRSSHGITDSSLLAEAPEPKRNKSIAWESQNLSNVPEEGEGGEEDDDEEEEEEDDSSAEDRNDYIKQLNAQHEEEKRRIWEVVEAKIREQVEDEVRQDTSKKWSVMMNNMRDTYTRMLRQTEDMYETRIEQRTEIISTSWKAYFDECQESSSLQLEEEKLKVQEREKCIAHLEQQLQSLPQDLEEIRTIGETVCHDLEEPNVPEQASSVQFTELTRPCSANLAVQTEVVELREMLKESGEAFLEKNAELSTLQESLKEKNDDLAQARVCINELKERMAHLEDELKKTRDNATVPAHCGARTNPPPSEKGPAVGKIEEPTYGEAWEKTKVLHGASERCTEVYASHTKVSFELCHLKEELNQCKKQYDRDCCDLGERLNEMKISLELKTNEVDRETRKNRELVRQLENCKEEEVKALSRSQDLFTELELNKRFVEDFAREADVHKETTLELNRRREEVDVLHCQLKRAQEDTELKARFIHDAEGSLKKVAGIASSLTLMLSEFMNSLQEKMTLIESKIAANEKNLCFVKQARYKEICKLKSAVEVKKQMAADFEEAQKRLEQSSMVVNKEMENRSKMAKKLQSIEKEFVTAKVNADNLVKELAHTHGVIADMKCNEETKRFEFDQLSKELEAGCSKLQQANEVSLKAQGVVADLQKFIENFRSHAARKPIDETKIDPLDEKVENLCLQLLKALEVLFKILGAKTETEHIEVGRTFEVLLKMQDQKQEHCRLQQELDEVRTCLKQKGLDVKQKNETVEQLSLELKDAKNDKQKTLAQLQTLSLELKSSQRVVEDFRDEIAAKSSSLDLLQEKVESLHLKLQHAEEAALNAEVLQDYVEKRTKETCNALKSILEIQSANMNTHEEQLRKLSTKLSSIEEKVRIECQVKAQTSHDLQNSRLALTVKEKESAELLKARETIRTLQDEMRICGDTMQALENTLKDGQLKKEELIRVHAELEQSKQNKVKLEGQVREIEDERVELRGKLADALKQMRHVEHKSPTHNDKLQELQQQQKELESCQAQCKALQHRLQEVEAGERDAKVQCESLKEQLSRQQTNKSGHELVEAEAQARWRDEQRVLIEQARQAENRRNTEIKRWEEERKRWALEKARCVVEKENLLQKLNDTQSESENKLVTWRQERDKLATALEDQLALFRSQLEQKDVEILSLRSCSTSTQACQEEVRQEGTEKHLAEGREDERQEEKGNEEKTKAKPSVTPAVKPQIASSSACSTRSQKAKLKNLVEVSQQPSSVHECTAKYEKHSRVTNHRYALRKTNMHLADDGFDTNLPETPVHPAAAGSDTSERKRRTCASPHKVGGQPDGALHRFGELLQNSPIKLRNKAKKVVESFASSESSSSSAQKPQRRTRRKLHTADISKPMQFNSNVSESEINLE